MKYVVLVLFSFLLVIFSAKATKEFCCPSSSAKCTGSITCKACSSCSSCKYYSSGGSCGVCITKRKPVSEKKPIIEKSSGQCIAKTKKGTRCSRNAQSGRSYCWQH